ncbi:hypothetical protein E2C01_081808 [Portunus trituberculatus]|uniref:Uncharacterized protein n=1 Tax=Portunus trituberculatus TaxID=210409 RepID=A0A5B7IXL5_PORTR|nr:hypothetical protein [Portunus trituberculatus]
MLCWTNAWNTFIFISSLIIFIREIHSRDRPPCSTYIIYFGSQQGNTNFGTWRNCIRDVAKSLQSGGQEHQPCPARNGHSLLSPHVSLQSIGM